MKATFSESDGSVVEFDVDDQLLTLIELRQDAGFLVADALRSDGWDPAQAVPHEQANQWNFLAQRLIRLRRLAEAAAVYDAMYARMLSFQGATSQRIHKGVPLVFLSDIHAALGHPATSARRLMLTLVEDALRDGPVVKPEAGVFPRLVNLYGVAPSTANAYAAAAHNFGSAHAEPSRFPERVLQECERQLRHSGLTPAPSDAEAGLYAPSLEYLAWLHSRLGDGTGGRLEDLAAHVLAAVPGTLVTVGVQTRSPEIDVLCAVLGTPPDFRAETGKYFLVECKDWNRPASFTVVAKFARVLEAAQCRLGVLFSGQGVTDRTRGGERDAANELRRLFHQRGIVIAVLDDVDVNALAEGANLPQILRQRYEALRFEIV